MPRPPAIPVPDKARVVLSILAAEVTVAEAAHRAKVSETTVGNWKRQFLEGGAAGGGGRRQARSERRRTRPAR
jgi:transposase